MTGVAGSEAERHREAGGVRSGEQLLRIGSFAILKPGQDTSEAGPARVGAGPSALTNRQLTRARLQLACPLSTAIARRHGSPPYGLVGVVGVAVAVPVKQRADLVVGADDEAVE
jgi:hypothetical protein